MSEIDLEIRNIRKTFGPVVAVDDASLTIEKGQIVSFLGPSGCGKSTLLNIISGFIEPDAGEVRLAGEIISHLPPNRRKTSMVFQHFALFPHMTVTANIRYGLEAGGMPDHTIRERVSEMVSLLKLNGLEGRYPGELSGGQRQRVAIARALAVRPKVLLLDEALSALDKNLREEMQIELTLLLRALDITTILVTHDQREAFAVSDRIALMDRGRIVQYGSPQDVYGSPATDFVFKFLGSANCIPGYVRSDSAAGPLALTDTGIRVEGRVENGRFADHDPVDLYVRSEDIRLSSAPTSVHVSHPGEVKLVTFLGSVYRYVVDFDGMQIVADRPTGAENYAIGEKIYFDFRPKDCHVVARSVG